MTDLAFLLIETFHAPNLNVEVIGAVKLVFAAHATHRPASRKTVTIKDFGGETLLLSKTDCSYRKAFEQQLAEKKIEPATILEFNAVEAIKRSVAAGGGIALIPRIAVSSEIVSKELVVLQGADMGWKTRVFMIWHKSKWISPALNTFMAGARQMLVNARVLNDMIREPMKN